MRVGIFSDSHGDCAALCDLLKSMGHIDAACFLGDVASDADYLRKALSDMPHQPVLYAVRGNNDFASLLPDQLLIELAGRRIWMEHGHRCPSLTTLSLRAREQRAQIALFGHTHQPFCGYDHGVLLLNPGSAGNACRGGKARASVLVMEQDHLRVEDVLYGQKDNRRENSKKC